MTDQRIVQQQLNDWRWIGKSGRLDQNPRKRRHFAAIAPGQKPAQRLLQIAAQRAADTAARENSDFPLDRLHQEMVERDLAKLIDDHGTVAHVGMAQQFVEQSRFAAAEKPGDHRDRQARRRVVDIKQSHARFP